MEKYFTNKILLNLAIFAFGIQFSNSLLLANLGSLYKFLGASGGILPYLGLAAPLSGLIIQPLIGHLSDDTTSHWGKRRPYLLFWSLLGIMACFCISWINSLLSAFILLWILGCSINGVSELLRALTGDIVINKDKPAAFSLQTVSSGLGATIAVSIPYIINKLISPAKFSIHSLPLAIKIAFITAAVVWSFSIYWLWQRVKEKPLSHQALLTNLQTKYNFKIGFKTKHFWHSLYCNIINMPKTMRQLVVIQFFTWIGLYAMWLYFSVAIAQHLYGLPIHYLKTNPDNILMLNKGAMQSNLYFGIYQFVSIIYALNLPWLSKYFSQYSIHGVSLCIGAVGLLVVCITHNPSAIGLWMVAVGILWGSVMTLPYAIISESLPSNKMGVYFGIFNISITLPQIIAGCLLPLFYNSIFFHHAIAVIIFSAVSIFTAGAITLYQTDNPMILKLKILLLLLYCKIKQQRQKLAIYQSH